MIIKFFLVFPKIFLLHKVVRDAKKVEKHCNNQTHIRVSGVTDRGAMGDPLPGKLNVKTGPPPVDILAFSIL